MSGVEILIIVAIVMQVVAMIISLRLIHKTKYSALWISCIVTLIALCSERVMQLMLFDGYNISDYTYAWVGIIVSLGISLSIVCARLLVNHVERMSHHRRLLENRLLTAVLRTEERSRASFSRELHDGLGPLLSSAKMSLSSLSKAELSDKERTTLQNTVAVIDEAIRSLREISNNLSPHVLNSFGLARGIKNFVDRTVALHDVKIEFSTPLMTNSDINALNTILSTAYSVAAERKLRVTYYDPESDSYKSHDCYMPDVHYQIRNVDTANNVINYEELRYAFIGY